MVLIKKSNSRTPLSAPPPPLPAVGASGPDGCCPETIRLERLYRRLASTRVIHHPSRTTNGTAAEAAAAEAAAAAAGVEPTADYYFCGANVQSSFHGSKHLSRLLPSSVVSEPGGVASWPSWLQAPTSHLLCCTRSMHHVCVCNMFPPPLWSCVVMYHQCLTWAGTQRFLVLVLLHFTLWHTGTFSCIPVLLTSCRCSFLLSQCHALHLFLHELYTGSTTWHSLVPVLDKSCRL